jgi:DNA (cytosine-5)-methyltransferase 1
MQSNGEWKENDEQRRGQSQSEYWENGINGITSDSDNGSGLCDTVQTRREEFKELYDLQPNTPDTESKRTREQSSENRGWEDGRFNHISKDGNVADTNINRRKYYNWDNFPTESPICGGDDGISHGLDNITFSKWRNESIKGYGNAVVPQIVYRIFKTIENIQNLKQND